MFLHKIQSSRNKGIVFTIGTEYVSFSTNIGIKIIFAIIMAIPFTIVWNSAIPTYFAFYIPEQLHNLGYWYLVGVTFLFTSVGEQIQRVIPKFISKGKHK